MMSELVMILDVYSTGWSSSTTFFAVLTICTYLVSISREIKYKSMTKNKESNKVKNQYIILTVLACILCGVTIFDWLLVSKGGGGIRNQWEDINTNTNEK